MVYSRKSRKGRVSIPSILPQGISNRNKRFRCGIAPHLRVQSSTRAPSFHMINQGPGGVGSQNSIRNVHPAFWRHAHRRLPDNERRRPATHANALPNLNFYCRCPGACGSRGCKYADGNLLGAQVINAMGNRISHDVHRLFYMPMGYEWAGGIDWCWGVINIRSAVWALGLGFPVPEGIWGGKFLSAAVCVNEVRANIGKNPISFFKKGGDVSSVLHESRSNK